MKREKFAVTVPESGKTVSLTGAEGRVFEFIAKKPFASMKEILRGAGVDTVTYYSAVRKLAGAGHPGVIDLVERTRRGSPNVSVLASKKAIFLSPSELRVANYFANNPSATFENACIDLRIPPSFLASRLKKLKKAGHPKAIELLSERKTRNTRGLPNVSIIKSRKLIHLSPTALKVVPFIERNPSAPTQQEIVRSSGVDKKVVSEGLRNLAKAGHPAAVKIRKRTGYR